MKCNYRNKIEAYHDGSLEQKDLVFMNNHLETCQSCQQYLSEMEYGDQRLAQLKSFRPELVNPDGFRVDVLNKIKPKRQNVFRNELIRLLDAVILLLLQPATRYTVVTAAIVFFGLFVYQQSSIVQKMDSLEKRLESNIQHEDSNTKSRKNIEAFLKREVEVKQQDKDFDELLQDYSQLQIRYKVLIKMLEERYPDAYQELQNEMKKELILFQNTNI